jgi:alpha-L-rhamnosidase
MLKAALLRLLFAGIVLIPDGELRANTPPRIQAPLAVVNLRTGGLENPLGFDDPQPRLSWQLRSGIRGTRQTAYRVIVASTAESLAQDRGDLWDTGRVESDENVRLVYSGVSLRSGQSAFWKVQVWDEKNQASSWSAAANWTAGKMSPADWSSATRWISDPELLRWQRAKLGYRSQPTTDATVRKWIQFDLGRSVPIESVRLLAIKHTVDENLGFPVRYQLEVADRADFIDARLVVPAAATDFNPWLSVIDLPLKNVTARFVRFTATKLRVFHGEACLAISQVEVMSGGKNLAPSAQATASDSVEDAQWALAAVNDGLGIPGANPRASDSLRLRRNFTVKAGLKRALLSVSGLGHYTLAVNGASVEADRLLTPGWTDYRKTCLYETHDLTAKLREGTNALGLTLAGGMYNVQSGFKRYVKFISAYRPLKAFGELRLEYVDGTTETIGTDARWRVSPGAETYANVFGGEDHDARRAALGWSVPWFDDSSWTEAAPTDGPGGVLRGGAWASPALVAHESLPPVAVREVSAGVTVYDFGQNVAMMPRLRVRGPAGARVRIIPAELLRANGTVDRGSSGGGAAYWQYTLNGHAAGEMWFPSFFYHGARYLQVELTAPEGAALPTVEKLESVVVHSDSPPAGAFASSHELFNRIHSLVRWAQRSNFTHVLSDCPHRERLGWLEQYHLNGPALRYQWDLSRLYAKSFNDMADAQRPNGFVPNIAPEYVVFDGGFVDSPEWGSAIILAAWQHYLFTGDDAPLRRHYGTMRKYVDYLTSRAEGHIVSHGLGDWYDLGPERPGFAQLTPVPLTATAIYYEDARALARIATLLGKKTDAAQFENLAVQIAAAFNRKFFNAEKGIYATGSQTAQAMPLVLGMAAPSDRTRVVAALVRDIEGRGNAVTAGDVGYRYLLRALADAGRSDVIHAMNNQSEKPGYGYQLARGATSLPEAWDANTRGSQNHFMLGQINEWFYQDLAGLGVDAAAPGFKNVVIRPRVVGDITWVEANHQSPYGRIEVRWERKGKQFVLKTTVPPNSTATLWLPSAGEVLESGTPAERATGVRFLRREGGDAVYAVESGTYIFEATL